MAGNNLPPWQVVPRQVFTPCSRLSISTVVVVVSCFGCLGVNSVQHTSCSVHLEEDSTVKDCHD